MKCLNIQNVSYRYEGRTDNVLKNINATFESGKVYAIIGQSGAGKSTLLSLISGLDTCKEGDIYYNGKNMREFDRDEYLWGSYKLFFIESNQPSNIFG